MAKLIRTTISLSKTIQESQFEPYVIALEAEYESMEGPADIYKASKQLEKVLDKHMESRSQ